MEDRDSSAATYRDRLRRWLLQGNDHVIMEDRDSPAATYRDRLRRWLLQGNDHVIMEDRHSPAATYRDRLRRWLLQGNDHVIMEDRHSPAATYRDRLRRWLLQGNDHVITVDRHRPGILVLQVLLLISSSAFAQNFDHLSLVPVATDLNKPVGIVNAGDGSGRLFIVERDGLIKILPANSNTPNALPFLDMSALVDSGGNEQGLLGLVFHPDYSNNGYFYVNYTRDPGPGSDLSVIARFSVSNTNADVADISSELKLMEIAQEAANHNGGDLHFGPDGFLYIALGDGGGGNDTYANAQNINTLKGAISRIDVDSAPGVDDEACGTGLNYAIPANNPFFDTAGCDEIWSFGLRNPWRFSFDRDTGNMFIGDVGQRFWEEIDFEPAATPGINYGWSCREGTHEFIDGNDCISAYTDPILEYGHTPACSVTGGYVYRGSNASFNGYYFYADYCSAQVWLAKEGGTGWATAEWLAAKDTLGTVSAFGEDEDGNLYIVDLQAKKVFRIVMLGDLVFADSFEQ